MPLPPVVGPVTKHGGYAFVRSLPQHGGCGVGKRPCVHWGLDIAARPGSLVLAPEAGTVVYAAPGTVRPLRGYGPAAILLRGASGFYHLLAHLASPLPLGEHVDGDQARTLDGPRVVEGQLLGTVGAPAHVHWEVRRTPLATDRVRETIHPSLWLGRDPSSATAVARAGGGAPLLFLAAAIILGGSTRGRSRR